MKKLMNVPVLRMNNKTMVSAAVFAHIEMKDGTVYDIMISADGVGMKKYFHAYNAEVYGGKALQVNPPTGSSMIQFAQDIDFSGKKIYLKASASELHASFDDLVELTDVPVPEEKTSFWDNPLKWVGEKVSDAVDWCINNPEHVRNFLIGYAVAVVCAVAILASCGTATPYLVAAAGFYLGGVYATYKAVEQDVKMGDPRHPLAMVFVAYKGARTGAIKALLYYYGRWFVKSPGSYGIFNVINGLLDRQMDTAWDRTLDTPWKRFAHKWNPGKMVKDYSIGRTFGIIAPKVSQAANRILGKWISGLQNFFGGGSGSQLVPSGPTGMVPYGQGGGSSLLPILPPGIQRFLLPDNGGSGIFSNPGNNQQGTGVGRGDWGSEKYASTPELEDHIIYTDPDVPRKRGIGGAHNKEEFLTNDVQIIESTPHSSIAGVETVTYQMPKLDKTGTPIPGEYQSGTPKKKTIYDPRIISDEEFIARGIQAANDAASRSKDGVLPREWTGYDSYGVKWRGYTDSNGNITSFYPED